MRFCDRCGAAFQSMRTCPRDQVPTRADISDPLIGQVIGDRYRVLDRLAAGGMGQVYRVAHVRIASQFALKVLYGDVAHDPEMRARFQREAEAASCLHSRHIVRVVDFGETSLGLSYLVMELIEGQSLGDVIARRGAIAEAEAIEIARQIARGLVHAHERGIVHRDLKPDNIMMVDEDEDHDVAKLLDFGLASAQSATKLTRAGQVFGTPQYMAPEQFLATDSDARTDLYALGVVLYEMLAGRLPFDATTLNELATMHCSVPPPPIATARPSPPLAAVIARLLAKRREDRFPSARAVLDALRPPSSSPQSAPTAAPEPAITVGVVERLRAAIQAGSPRYNVGDHAGCLAIYRTTAERLLAETLDPGRQIAIGARLRVGLSRAARAGSPSEAAWEMRYAFDDLLHSASRPRSSAGDHVMGEIDLAEAVAAGQYAAGNLGIVGEYGAQVARDLADDLRRSGGQPPLQATLDRVAHAAANAGGGQRAIASLRESLELLRNGASPTLTSAPVLAETLAQGCPGLDRHAHRIVQAIGAGAPAYNAGDVAGCYRIYKSAAEAIVAEVTASGTCGHLAARLRGALQEASALNVDRAAWTMRHAFDDVLAAAQAAAR